MIAFLLQDTVIDSIAKFSSLILIIFNIALGAVAILRVEDMHKTAKVTLESMRTDINGIDKRLVAVETTCFIRHQNESE